MVPFTIRKKVAYIALVALSVVTLVGVGLSVYVMNADKTVIKVDLTPDEPSTVSFKNIGLRPGESCVYTLKLNNEYADEYDLTLDFLDSAPELTLKQYAYVRLEMDGQVLCDELLSSAFEREDITAVVNFTGKDVCEIKVTYYMPEDVGNEAQDAEAKFELIITAENE